MNENIIKQPPLPDTIHFNHTRDNDRTEVMRITRDGVWVNPDMQVDETAKAVLDALDYQVKVLVQRAVEEEREKVAKWMMSQGYATGHGDTIEDLLKELEWQVAERERERDGDGDGDGVNILGKRVDETVKSEHEPVAWAHIENNEIIEFETDKEECEACEYCVPLYLAPPKREWVGLDGEIPGLGLVTEEFYNGMLFAEDILREKNT